MEFTNFSELREIFTNYNDYMSQLTTQTVPRDALHHVHCGVGYIQSWTPGAINLNDHRRYIVDSVCDDRQASTKFLTPKIWDKVS